MKVTDAPAQVGLAPEVMAMVLVGVALLDTVTVMALEVTMQVTTAPLVNVEVVKVAALVPVFTPFTCH